MQLIFWAHSNSATKHLKRNFLQQIEKVLYIFWLRGHSSSTTESEEKKQNFLFKMDLLLSLHPANIRLSGDSPVLNLINLAHTAQSVLSDIKT